MYVSIVYLALYLFELMISCWPDFIKKSAQHCQNQHTLGLGWSCFCCYHSFCLPGSVLGSVVLICFGWMNEKLMLLFQKKNQRTLFFSLDRRILIFSYKQSIFPEVLNKYKAITAMFSNMLILHMYSIGSDTKVFLEITITNKQTRRK